jgi:hypothetical protein
VVIALVDQDDLHIGVPQRMRCGDPAKPPTTITTRLRSGRSVSATAVA